MNFVTMWLFQHFKYTHVLTLAVTLQLVGGWFRSYAIITDTFWPILAGTTVMSLSAGMFW
jgi:hypothetical protein